MGRWAAGIRVCRKGAYQPPGSHLTLHVGSTGSVVSPRRCLPNDERIDKTRYVTTTPDKALLEEVQQGTQQLSRDTLVIRPDQRLIMHGRCTACSGTNCGRR
jgi:hypothetical protein